MLYKLVIYTVCFFPLFTFAQLVEVKKQLSKTFAANKEINVDISNKYGDIQIFSWDKDSVKIDIFVKITDKQLSKAEKMLTYIDFDLTGTPFYVNAKTIFKNYKGTVLGDITDIANSWMNSTNNLSITYMVYIPVYTPIKISNKFGNIYTTNHNANFDVYLANGDLKANNLKGSNKIMVEFGNARINYFNKGNITLSYGQLDVVEANDLSLETKSSTINLEKCSTITLNSKRDKYRIDTLSVLKGTANFSYIKCNYLTENLNTQMQFGELNIADLNNSFRFINLTASSTDVFITIPSNTNANFNLKYRKTNVAIAESIATLQKELVAKEKDVEDWRTYGIIGEKKDNISDIQINMTYGTLHFEKSK